MANKSFKDRLLSLVVEVEEVPDEVTQQPAATPQTTFKAPKGNAQPQPATVEPDKGLPSINLTGDKFMGYLRKKIEDNDLPGPDFLELVRVANSYDESLAKDKPTAIKLAFQSLRGIYSGFSKDIILKSIDTYVKLIEDEKARVAETVKNERTIHVDGAKKQLKDIDANIAKFEAEIERLKAQREPIQNGVSAAEQRINEFEQNALTAITEVVDDLKANKAEINSIL